MKARTPPDLSYRDAPDATDLAHIPGDDGLPVLGQTLAMRVSLVGIVPFQDDLAPLRRIERPRLA